MKPLEELLIDDQEFLVARDRISMEKQALQAQIAEINAKCVVRLPNREYQKLQSERGQLVRLISEKEREFSEIKLNRAALNVELGIAKIGKGMPVSRIKDLVATRDKWHGFSMSSNNHQKAREAAWQFSQELGAILKLHFDGTV